MLDEIAERHVRLIEIAATYLTRLRADPPETEQLTIAIELAAEFTHAMEPDPLLPPELLPQPWPGTEARELLAQCWRYCSANRTTTHRAFSRFTPRPHDQSRSELAWPRGTALRRSCPTAGS